jgi:hypothetical protein
MIAARESLQGKPSCELNVNQTKWFSSLAPSGIITNQSCLMPITINVDIDNVGKIDSVKEDKGIIDKHGTHMMPSAWVINRGHLL